MQTDRRLKVLESNLKGKERFLLWLKRAQAAGGFFDHCRTLNGPLIIEDEETSHLFDLVNRCNLEILEIRASPVARLFALYLIRLTLSEDKKAHEVEIREVQMLLQWIVVESFALDTAIRNICKDYLGGSQVLFGDIQEEISRANQERARLRDTYNLLAPKIGFEPFEEDAFQSSVATAAAKKADELIRLSLAKASAVFGNFHEAYESLLPLVEPSMSA